MDVQISSRVGKESTQIGSPSKSKTSESPLDSSSHGKDIVGSSSSSTHPPLMNTSRKFVSDRKKKSLLCELETDESEDSDSVPNTSSGKAYMNVHPEPHDHKLDDVVTSGPSNRFMKGTVQKFGWTRNRTYASRYSLRNSRYKSVDNDRRNNLCNSSRGISISDRSSRTRNLNSSRDNDDDATSVISLQNRNFRLPPMIESPLLTLPSPQPENISVDSSRRNGDTLRQFNFDGIAEMLLALERIVREEEPSYEQLLVLETNLLIGGVSFHDQHRDMRLDIDNMSYEELLALEEKIGSVSTGVAEEALTTCLEKEIFEGVTDIKRDEDDIKCCIL